MKLKRKAGGFRHSAEEKAKILTRYASSGKTQVAFCREAGITVPTLAAWRRAAAPPPPSSTRLGELVEVRLPAPAEARLEVNGWRVWVGVGTSPAWLGAVVQQLRACSI